MNLLAGEEEEGFTIRGNSLSISKRDNNSQRKILLRRYIQRQKPNKIHSFTLFLILTSKSYSNKITTLSQEKL